MLRHFFSLQRVLSRRIQQKYFIQRVANIKSHADKDAQRNITTRTFFNFLTNVIDFILVFM